MTAVPKPKEAQATMLAAALCLRPDVGLLAVEATDAEAADAEAADAEATDTARARATTAS